MQSRVLNLSEMDLNDRFTVGHYVSPDLALMRKLDEGVYPLEPLGNLAVVRGGKRLPPKAQYSPFGVPYVRVVDFGQYEIELDNAVYISENLHEQIKRYQLCYDDIGIVIVGATIGKVAIYKSKTSPCNFNENLARITVKDEKINPDYLLAFLQSCYGQAYINWLTGGAAQAKLSLERIQRIRVPLPPWPLQDRIAQIMQDAYATRQANLAQAENISAKVNDQVLLVLGIDWSEIEDVKEFTVPISELTGSRFDVRYRSPRANHALELLEKSGHEVVALGELLSLIYYGASVKNDYSGNDIPFIRISNLEPNQINTHDLVYFPESKRGDLGKAFVYTDDLLMSRSGSVGIVAVVSPTVNGFAFGSFQIKFRLQDSSINPYYVAYVLNSPLGSAQVGQQKTGSIQMNITIEGIKNLRLPLPPRELQDEIVQEANNLRAESDRLREEADAVVSNAKEHVERLLLGEVSLT